MDMISKLPSPIIEDILSHLSIQEAARTSILSKEWRYHWINLPKLVFIEDTFQVTSNITNLSVLEQPFYIQHQMRKMAKSCRRCKHFYTIYQVLLTHVGPIHEFTLSVRAKNSCDEIDRILDILSQNETVKKLKLEFTSGYRYTLPLSLFSFRELTDLYLDCCYLDQQPSFGGFDRLTSLYVENLKSSMENLFLFLSMCPLLKTVTLNIDIEVNELYSGWYTAYNLFECLPMIESLVIWWDIIRNLDFEVDLHELPTKLVHLKSLCIEDIILFYEDAFPVSGLPVLVPLIKSSPNLEKLKIQIFEYLYPYTDDESYYYLYESGPFTFEDYKDIWLEHLSEFEIINLYLEAELDFVKFILARSPNLKKVRIFLYYDDVEAVNDEKLRISEVLVSSPKASSVVEIIIGYLETNQVVTDDVFVDCLAK